MNIYITNQGKTGACTVHALCGCINYINQDRVLDPIVIWDEVKKKQASAGSWRIQAATLYAKKKGWIKDICPVTTIYGLLLAFKQGPVITMSFKLDFIKTNKSKDKIAVFDEKIDSKHARFMFESCIVGGEKVIKCVNSWGNARGDEGCFYIRYSDISKIGAKYLLTK